MPYGRPSDTNITQSSLVQILLLRTNKVHKVAKSQTFNSKAIFADASFLSRGWTLEQKQNHRTGRQQFAKWQEEARPQSLYPRVAREHVPEPSSACGTVLVLLAAALAAAALVLVIVGVVFWGSAAAAAALAPLLLLLSLLLLLWLLLLAPAYSLLHWISCDLRIQSEQGPVSTRVGGLPGQTAGCCQQFSCFLSPGNQTCAQLFGCCTTPSFRKIGAFWLQSCPWKHQGMG